MSYRKRSPCQKYFDKSIGAPAGVTTAVAGSSQSTAVSGQNENIQKSLSNASRFMTFRRTSDTTSDSGSDDFKLEPLDVDVSSSFSRSSSESCHSGTFGPTNSSRYHCSVKNLSDILDGNNNSRQLEGGGNESLDDFKSRLNMRRRVKTRQEGFASTSNSSNFNQQSQDDDNGHRTDNSCDSTTLKAHEEILRNANLLKQEQVNRSDGTGYAAKVAAYHEASSFKKKFANSTIKAKNETILMNKFDKILRIQNSNDQEEDEEEEEVEVKADKVGDFKEISRSSTDNFLAAKTNKPQQQQHAKLSPKSSHSQVLKTATSIPSMMFTNRSLKIRNRSETGSNSTQQTYEPLKQVLNETKINIAKKGSIDDEFFSVGGSYKNRRSPLQILGNFVDDKLFKKRWSSTKRAKSTDEITWALANEEVTMSRQRQNELLMNSSGSSSGGGSSASRFRKKSAGFILGNTKFFDDNVWSGWTGSSSKKDKLMNRVSDLKKRKSSNTSSHSDSTSLNSISEPNHYSMVANTHVHHLEPANRHASSSSSPANKQVSPETMAEIESFEELLKTHLSS